jgi:hypothetical protein
MATMIQHIVGVYITPDFKNTTQLQEIFTLYGNIIKTRLGLNHLEDAELGLKAVIILELYGDQAQIDLLTNELLAVDGLKLGELKF